MLTSKEKEALSEASKPKQEQKYMIMAKKKYSLDLFQSTDGTLTFDLDEARVRLDTLQSMGIFAFLVKVSSLDFALFDIGENRDDKEKKDKPA